MTWKDGSYYEGEWEYGIQHGFGRMNFPNGDVKEGMFENNVYRGENGDMSETKSRMG